MIEFNKELSKQIYAGADMFLMPSKERAVRALADDSIALRNRSDRPRDGRSV